MVGKGGGECEAAGRIESAIRKQKERSLASHLTLSFYSSWILKRTHRIMNATYNEAAETPSYKCPEVCL